MYAQRAPFEFRPAMGRTAYASLRQTKKEKGRERKQETRTDFTLRSALGVFCQNVNKSFGIFLILIYDHL